MTDPQQEETKQLFLQDDECAPSALPKRKTQYRRGYGGILFLLMLLVVFILLLLRLSPATYQTRPGELSEPRLPMVQYHFTGGLKYDSDGSLYRDTSGESQTYVGNSSDVADAWKVFDIIQTVELDKGTVGTQGLYTDHRPMVVTILDVYHQLHCLNKIRESLYGGGLIFDADPKLKMHVEHCVDYLRQIIQCQSDLTPLKLYYSESAKRIMVDFEGSRVCRDFEQLTEWAWAHRLTKVEMF